MNYTFFRHCSVQVNPKQLIAVASELVEKATYCSPAFCENAPFSADCLTAIHYIFKQALNVDIPLTFVGDMPRKLSHLKTWDLIQCPLEEAQCGDLFFAKNKNKPKLISHIALIIETDKIFHCNRAAGKAVIQSREEFFFSYEQKICLEKMIRYIDSRNKELRSKEGVYVRPIEEKDPSLTQDEAPDSNSRSQ